MIKENMNKCSDGPAKMMPLGTLQQIKSDMLDLIGNTDRVIMDIEEKMLKLNYNSKFDYSIINDAHNKDKADRIPGFVTDLNEMIDRQNSNLQRLYAIKNHLEDLI